MKYGFVYIWYDKKHKRYYVGCHWGSETDNYICSSRWMRNSYRRRPDDFKRRILSYVYTNRNDLHEEEYRWLAMMKPEELHGPRYYNIRNHHFIHWSANPQTAQSIKEKATGKKLSADTIEKRQNTRMLNNGYNFSEETKAKMSESRKGEKNPFHGKTHSDETRRKLSEINNGKKLSKENVKKRIATRKANGFKQSDETRMKIAESVKAAHMKRKDLL